MKNRKGFTLVEVLGVIVILAILAGLVIAGIMKYFQEGKEDYNVKLSHQLEISGKTYFASNRQLLPTSISAKKYAFVTLPELQNGNYVAKEFTDSEGRECSPSYVFVKQRHADSNEYDYIPCLICQDSNGNKKDYSGDEVYCDPANWEDNVIPQEAPEEEEPEPPVPPTGAFTCKGVYKNGVTTITKATSAFGINKMYYLSSTGSKVNIALTAEEYRKGEVKNKKLPTSVPKDADIFMDDIKGNTSGACDIEYIPDEPTPTPGAPVCKFANTPSGYVTTTTDLSVVCSNDTDKIKVVDRTKIVSVNAYGTLTITADKLQGSVITFNVKYTPKSNIEGTEYLKAKSGLVQNVTDGKTNNETETRFRVDTKPPVIKYTVTKGTLESATALDDTGRGYKNSVTVQVKCTDKYGIKTMKVNKTSSSNPVEVKIDKAGTNTLATVCIDNSSHKSEKSEQYRILNYHQSCGKCGVATRTNCIKYCKYPDTCCTGGWYNTYSYYWYITNPANPYSAPASNTYCSRQCNYSNYGYVCDGYGHATYAAVCSRTKTGSQCSGWSTSYSACGCTSNGWDWKTGDSCPCASGKYCWY